MSELREKSQFNRDAARVLLEKQLYAPSVHCSYFSCFQLLKYTIQKFFGIDYNNQEETRLKLKQNSHQYVINFITNELKSLAGTFESRRIERKIKDLRQFRIESDYENIEIDAVKGNTAMERAEEIRRYIIHNFHV